MARRKPTKRSSSKAPAIAGKVLAGKKPAPSEVRTLAASVLAQDETRGQKTTPHRRTSTVLTQRESGGSTRVIGVKKNAQGGETWHIVSDTGSHKIRTSPTSVKAMDEAKVLYADALKRLAKR